MPVVLSFHHFLAGQYPLLGLAGQLVHALPIHLAKIYTQQIPRGFRRQVIAFRGDQPIQNRSLGVPRSSI